MVGLLDEVLQLPDGLNTLLQTGGRPLSHNQALRLMLARAIVGRPRLLLIDGTLDALPDGQAQRLLESLVGPDAGWTTLVASSRPVLIDICKRNIHLRPIDPASHDTDHRAERG